MAIRAYNITFFYFFSNLSQKPSTANQTAYRHNFSSTTVIELQNYDIGFATIYTRMFYKVVTYKIVRFIPCNSSMLYSLLKVLFPISVVVSAHYFAVTFNTMWISVWITPFNRNMEITFRLIKPAF